MNEISDALRTDGPEDISDAIENARADTYRAGGGIYTDVCRPPGEHLGTKRAMYDHGILFISGTVRR